GRRRAPQRRGRAGEPLEAADEVVVVHDRQLAEPAERGEGLRANPDRRVAVVVAEAPLEAVDHAEQAAETVGPVEAQGEVPADQGGVAPGFRERGVGLRREAAVGVEEDEEVAGRRGGRPVELCGAAPALEEDLRPGWVLARDLRRCVARAAIDDDDLEAAVEAGEVVEDARDLPLLVEGRQADRHLHTAHANASGRVPSSWRRMRNRSTTRRLASASGRTPRATRKSGLVSVSAPTGCQWSPSAVTVSSGTIVA